MPARREPPTDPAAVGPRTEDAQQPRPVHQPRVGDQLPVRLHGKTATSTGHARSTHHAPATPARGTWPVPAPSMRASNPSADWSRPCTHWSTWGRDDGPESDRLGIAAARAALYLERGLTVRNLCGSVDAVLPFPLAPRGTDHSPPVPCAPSDERVRDLSVPAGAYDRTLENRARHRW